LTTWTSWSRTAIPNESYPRYSSLFKPSIRTGAALAVPLYPKIPHTSDHQGAIF